MLTRALDRIVHEERGRVLASLIRVLGDFQLAEDAFQDAVASALERWPRDGLPESPGAWLTAVARRKGLDRLRHEAVIARTEPRIRDEVLRQRADEGRPDASDPWGLSDERLRLIFTCCHPALSLDAQVALTLRTLGGLTTREIARAFLVPEPALAQRLVRAKKKIREARIPYEVPGRDQIAERLDAVLGVIYLIFNEGYLASSGPAAMRRDLCREAIRLGRILAELLPDQPEVEGLWALMLLHDSRGDARFDARGELIELDRQDRARWNRGQIEQGTGLVVRALKRGAAGPYQLQAAIAALHAEAAEPEATDWPQIAALYDLLYLGTPTDMVALNRIIAWAMVRGPAVGLHALDALPAASRQRLGESWTLTRADLLTRAGRLEEADREYERARERASNPGIRGFIDRRRSELTAARSSTLEPVDEPTDPGSSR